MRIGIDIMGGDYAPEAIVLGILSAQKLLSSGIKIVMLGNQDKIKEILTREKADPANFDIIHTTEVIGMGDHPSKAFSQKTNSSIAVGFHMLRAGEIDGFASAGSTGAMLVGCMYTIKSIEGIIRPCIMSPIPQEHGGYSYMLDVGINSDCRPDVLYQYGILGKIYAENVSGIKNPRVALLNIGSEEEKGNLITKATHELMKNTHDFDFIGNIEANELFNDKADVIVCDGFTGNVMLKEAEAFYSLIKRRNRTDDFFDKFNFELYGGTPVLGINSTVMIGHGISGPVAIKNMILHTRDVIEAKVCQKIKEAF
ncbi:MAG: phosphate acyltransferase PlsX [Bacteroidia bacterium]|nr:phosphate acyltransferase PlsX [Bacteroidia bacterium]